MKKHLGTIIAFVLLAGGVVLIILSSTNSGAYSLNINEVLKNRSTLKGHELRVSGTVVRGSLSEGSTAFDHTFEIADENGRTIRVTYHGALPDPFAEGRHVIVQGILQDNGVVEASQLIVKCPSKYVEKGKAEASDYQYYLNKYKQGHPKGK